MSLGVGKRVNSCAFCRCSAGYFICSSCCIGAKDIIELIQQRKPREESHDDAETETSEHWQSLATVAAEVRRLEDLAAKRSTYLNELVEAILKELPEDLEVVADEGLSLRAHKVVLTSRSQVLTSMLETDMGTIEKCLSIRVPDIGHIELKHFIEFIYSGQLTLEALKDHSKALIVAADKFDIPLLIEVCEAYLIQTLSMANALEILELSARLSSPAVLEKAALDIIESNWKRIMFSNEYEEFAMKNPHLAVKVSRSVLKKF